MGLTMQSQRFQGHHNGASTRGMTPITLLKILLFCMISLNLTACATSPSSYKWTHIAPSNFPAKVDQIITEYGNLLDQRHRSGYGEWDVRVTGDPPVATYICLSPGACQIIVNKLQCTNGHSKGTECAVRLDMNKKVCRLLVPEKQQALPIRCPLDVVLSHEESDPENVPSTSPSESTAAVRF